MLHIVGQLLSTQFKTFTRLAFCLVELFTFELVDVLLEGQVVTSTSQLFALTIIRDMVHDAGVDRGIDAEFRIVSIPDGAPKNGSDEMFDREYMRALEAFGRTIGSDPSHWTDAIPSVFKVD